jgi:hypothetical protein
VDLTYLSIPDSLKFRGQRTLFKSWEKGLDSSYIAPSFKRALSVRLVVIGTIIVIAPLLTSLLFKALVLLMPVFDPTMGIFAVDDITQVSIIPVSPSTAFLWWSETESPHGLYRWSSS